MADRWAMIQNGVCINVCLWDGLTTTWQPPDGIEMQPAPDHIGRDWRYENGEWLEPIPPEPAPEPVPEPAPESE